MTLRNSCCLPANKGKQLLLVTSLVCILMAIQVSALSAAPALPPTPPSAKNQDKNKQPKTIDIEASYGYRQDDLDWNIAGDLKGKNPNVLSELKWRDLLIHEFHLGMRTKLKKAFYLKGSISYGVIYDGDNRDSDYVADNREEEFSRSNNDAGQGNTLDGLLGAGYRFRLISQSFSVIPLVGYSYHHQHLKMKDGFQTVTWAGGPPLGPFEDLDSSYKAEWQGPWIGFEMILETIKFTRVLPPISFYAGWEYHWADYYAKADWNLRDDFNHPKSFEHEADGTGMVASLGVCLRLSDKWSVRVGYETEEWSTDRGVDRLFLANNTIVKTRLNEVNWHSEVILFGCSVRF